MSPEDRRSSRRWNRRAGVIALGRACLWHSGHAGQVARLVGQLFRQVSPPAGVALVPGPVDEWLEYAAFLHDIGYIIDVRGHHKHAARLIRGAELPGLLPHEISIIALVVRCHRKNWPGEDDKAFIGLGRADILTIKWLAGLLRVADGLDRTHANLVSEISVSDTAAKLDIGLFVTGQPESEIWAAGKKSDLLASLLGRPVLFRVLSRRNPSRRDVNDGTTLRETQA